MCDCKYVCNGWKVWSNGTTSLPKSITRLVLDKVREVFVAEVSTPMSSFKMFPIKVFHKSFISFIVPLLVKYWIDPNLKLCAVTWPDNSLIKNVIALCIVSIQIPEFLNRLNVLDHWMDQYSDVICHFVQNGFRFVFTIWIPDSQLSAN